MRYDDLPVWVAHLEKEDLNFIKKMILSSGSLKDLAKEYNVTYPTMRNRLDKLIEKIKIYDQEETDEFIEKIKILAIDDKIDLETAKLLIEEYRGIKRK